MLEALAAIGDEHCFEDVTFEPATDFVWMPKSIWNDLFDAVLIQDFRIPGHFGLTQHGWHHALKLAGDWESPALRDRGVSLVAALKGAVDGRHDDIAIDTAEIATSAGLPLGWTKSAIKSLLLSDVFGGRSHYVPFDERCETLTIPANFGQTRFTL